MSAGRHAAVGVLVACVMLVSASAASAATGPYLDFAEWPTFAPGQSTSGPTFIGPEGVPQVGYPWGVEDNPITVSHWALQHWSWWLECDDDDDERGDDDDRQVLLRAADWLVSKQRDDGGFSYEFDTDGGGVPMRAPWISAMAQGEAISVLVRAYSTTNDVRYLAGARLALQPFTKTYAEGGVRAEWDGFTWFEEYPGESPKHVLNGFEVSLLGLHDLAALDPLAAALFAEGAAALDAKIAIFDAPDARSQFYAALQPGHGVPPRPYPHLHAVLTRELANATGSAVLGHWATVWEGYERPLPRPSVMPIVTVIPRDAVAPLPVATAAFGAASCDTPDSRGFQALADGPIRRLGRGMQTVAAR